MFWGKVTLLIRGNALSAGSLRGLPEGAHEKEANGGVHPEEYACVVSSVLFCFVFLLSGDMVICLSI